jgi:hypothetical protein
MLPAATVRALLNPAFTAAEFTPTWSQFPLWAHAIDSAASIGQYRKPKHRCRHRD